MEQKEIIKYLDNVISNIEDVTLFSPNNILHDHAKLKWKTDQDKEKFNEVLRAVVRFGNAYDYWERKGTGSWYVLKSNGIELKDFGKGHVKFQKKSKSTPITKYQKIYLTLFIISLLFSGFMAFRNNQIKSENTELQKKLDSIQSINDNRQIPLSDGIWRFETDSVPLLEIRNDKWIFLNRGYDSETRTHYQIQFLDSLPEFVNTNDHGQLVRLANNYDTLHLEILGRSKKFFSFMDYPSGEIIFLIPMN